VGPEVSNCGSSTIRHDVPFKSEARESLDHSDTGPVERTVRGGWGETPESCRSRVYVDSEAGKAVMTSWALMALTAAGFGVSDPVRRGVGFLTARQLPEDLSALGIGGGVGQIRWVQ
jgi:hypothetical protein